MWPPILTHYTDRCLIATSMGARLPTLAFVIHMVLSKPSAVKVSVLPHSNLICYHPATVLVVSGLALAAGHADQPGGLPYMGAQSNRVKQLLAL